MLNQLQNIILVVVALVLYEGCTENASSGLVKSIVHHVPILLGSSGVGLIIFLQMHLRALVRWKQGFGERAPADPKPSWLPIPEFGFLVGRTPLHDPRAKSNKPELTSPSVKV